MKAPMAREDRAQLIERRRTEYPAKHGKHTPDFAPGNGYCYHCHADLVTEDWPTEFFTGCRKCHRSYCD